MCVFVCGCGFVCVSDEIRDIHPITLDTHPCVCVGVGGYVWVCACVSEKTHDTHYAKHVYIW